MMKSCRIDPKVVQNPSKIDLIRTLGRFEAFSAPFRAQVGARMEKVTRCTSPFGALGLEMAPEGAVSLPPLDPKLLQNRISVAYGNIPAPGLRKVVCMRKLKKQNDFA